MTKHLAIFPAATLAVFPAVAQSPPNSSAAMVPNSAGSAIALPLSVANGGTGDTGTAWSTFTPSPACGTATFTVNAAKSKTLGKTTHWQFDVTITAIGTGCTNSMTVTLPLTSNSAGGGAGREIATTGFNMNCEVPTASAALACAPNQQGITTATAFAVNNRLVASGVYENQ